MGGKLAYCIYTAQCVYIYAHNSLSRVRLFVIP